MAVEPTHDAMSALAWLAYCRAWQLLNVPSWQHESRLYDKVARSGIILC